MKNKSFANWTHLMRLTIGHKIYVELSNGYFVPVVKSHLKRVADAAAKNDDKFCGNIVFLEGNKKQVQITLN